MVTLYIYHKWLIAKYSLGGDDELPPAVLLLVAGVLPAQELGHLLRRELSLAHVPKVPRQVDRLA